MALMSPKKSFVVNVFSVRHDHYDISQEHPPLNGFHVTKEEDDSLVQGDTH